MQSQKLSSLQLELLKIYSFQPKEEDLMAVKEMLAKYFAEKLQKRIDQSVEEKNITEEDLNRWINE
ncbi:MAG: hypothetical protein ABJA76_14075 [Mucilaginibacter sp.]